MDSSSKKRSLDELWGSSYLAGGNAAYLEQLYENFLQDPNSVGGEWRERFETLPCINGTSNDVSHADIRKTFRQLARQKQLRIVSTPTIASTAGSVQSEKQAWILQFIDSYRFLGHLQSTLDPLGMTELAQVEELRLAHYGLGEQDLETVFHTGTLSVDGNNHAPLKDIVAQLKRLYCGNIGIEYMHISDADERNWIMQRVEAGCDSGTYSAETKKQLLDRVTAAEGLERYLHTKYTGQKRFSLEGAESLIPLLDTLVKRGGSHGVKEIIVGMAHRGRLNVLINVMGKRPSDLFLEFEGKVRNNGEGTGDVKYHLGFSSNINTPGGPVHMALAFNPSHLEIVGPVVEGSVRARQEGRNDNRGDQVVPLLIHGDAAFAGQGVVMETLNMSQSRGYATKGTMHIVINNQVGFTTSNQKDSRSTLYCTDVAKMVNAPIFHVNGDDPEAVLFVTQIALDYRMTFHKDVVIDLVCYRRHGHSEADEPSATQPMMYQRIKSMKTTRGLYADALASEGVIAEEEGAEQMNRFRDALDAGDGVVPGFIREEEIENPYTFDWTPYLNGNSTVPVDTRVELGKLREYAEQMHQLPDGFVLHSNVNKIFNSRHKMAAGALPVDWGFAETMAYATLMKDGYSVRLSGQDCGRGTFFHRHAVLYN
ncbi:MAG: 2-oxoglutarate dehydrogenase E1 component, partial [Candidatus Marinimicrobia bacterium]|nr:2-oxoglutarate dehydrogenase E1 component [Candidatus Neomarinimicrobiota bacterium]